MLRKIHKKYIFIGSGFFFLFFSFFLFRVSYSHFASFGCFDECFNYVAGHFIVKKRVLYSEIFFNHQILMPYISAFLQQIFNPQSIYSLVLQHRMFIFFFGIVLNFIIFYRFGLPGFGFSLLFEATKFYFMGSLFLAESILVYPLVYLFGLTWHSFNGEKLSRFDLLVSAVFSWFVLFLREPALLITILLYFLIIFGKGKKQDKYISVAFFLALSGVTLLFTSLKEYIFQVFILNGNTVLLSEIHDYGNAVYAFYKIFLYPVQILIDGKWTFLREILIGIDSIFLISIVIIFIKKLNKKLIFFLLISLGLANFRSVSPGIMYYESFHMLFWYGLFLMATFLLVEYLYNINKTKKIAEVFIVIIIGIFLFSVFSPQSVFHDSVDRNENFRLSFDRYYIYGQAIKYLAKPGDTIFLEGWDDLIYWQADLAPAYHYVIYKNLEKKFPSFARIREQMFQKNPPDFYYSLYANGEYPFGYLPSYRKNDYVELIYIASPSGLFVKKTGLSTITQDNWEKVKTLRFYLPSQK